MTHISSCLLLILCLWTTASDQLSATITSALVYNAYTHSQNLGTFSCVAEGNDNIRWLVDGKLHSFLPESRGIAVYISFLSNHSEIRIQALPVNRHIAEIKCRAYDTTTNPYQESDSPETAQFNIQGLLEMPPNITYKSYNSSHNTIEWQEPYTLDITDIEPDIENYTVCTNVSSECVNSTHAALNFTIPKFYVPILVSVTAWNIVGESNSSADLVIEGCPQEILPLEGERFALQVAFEANNITVIHITFQEHQTESDGECLYLYEVNVHSRGMTVWSTATWLHRNNNSMSLRLPLRKNHHYTISVNRTAHLSVLMLRSVDFSTHDLQNVDINKKGHLLWITYDFALGTTAKLLTETFLNDSGVRILQRDYNLNTECASEVLRPCSINSSVDLSSLLEMSVWNTSIYVSDWEATEVANSVQFTLILFTTNSSDEPLNTQQYTTQSAETITVVLAASIGGGALGAILLFLCLSVMVLGIFCKRKEESSCFEKGCTKQAVPMYSIPLRLRGNEAYEITGRNQSQHSTARDEVHLYDEIDLPPAASCNNEPVYAEVTI